MGKIRKALKKSAYKVLTRTPESKKPRLVAEAKCLTILVGRQRFELWTYGLRVFRPFILRDSELFPSC